MTGPGEYSGRGRPERVSTSPRTPVPAPEQHRTPAEISMVQEIVEAVAAQVMSMSRTSMRRETRPLKWSIAGVIGALLAAIGWTTSQVGAWQESMHDQWSVEQKQAEQDEAMAEHLSASHVSPARIEAIEARLGHIESKLGELLERTAKLEPAPTKRGR